MNEENKPAVNPTINTVDIPNYDAINRINTRIENSKNSKEILQLRGRLIELLKKTVNEVKDPQLKTRIDLALFDELKKHKEHIKKMRQEAKAQKYPIPERVSLKVKEIALTTEIFMKKADLPGRLKSGAISGVICGAIATAFGVGISALTGGLAAGLPALIAANLPIAAYCGLSSVISAMIDGSPKSKLYKQYENAPEETRKELEFCQKYISENEVFIKASLREQELKDAGQKIINEKRLINEYKKMIEHAPSDDVRQVLTLEMIEVMKKLEYNYKYQENEYLNNRIQMSTEEYKKMVAEKNEISGQIKKESSFRSDVVKTVGKSIAKQTAISYVARLMLSTVIPSLSFVDATTGALKGIHDLLEPFYYTLFGNLFAIGTVKESIKAKKTNYTGTIIKMTHPELFEKKKQQYQINQGAALQAA